MTEAQKNKIIKKIDRLKKEMRREKQEWGGYHDGRGIRYSIAELYFKLGDFKKTNRYISWFDKTFPDDGTYPYFQLGTAVAKFHAKKDIEAKQRIVEVVSQNSYLLYLLVGTEIIDQDKHEWTESESLNWAKKNLTIHEELIDQGFVTWLSDFMAQAHFKSHYKRFISIKKLLKDMDVSDERSKLLDAERECIEIWKKEIKENR